MRDLINDVFVGKLQNVIECKKCKSRSVKEDSFFELLVPIEVCNLANLANLAESKCAGMQAIAR